MTKEQRRTITLEYWGTIAAAVAWLIISGLIAGTEHREIHIGTYFAVGFLILHAHGRRIRDTILVLHGEKP